MLLLVACVAAGCRGPRARWVDAAARADLSFEGNQAFDDEELRRVVGTEIADLDERPVDKASIDDAAYAIELFYRGRGFPDVTVDYEFVPGSEDGARPGAVFNTDEGPRVLVERLDLEGAVSIAGEELAALTSKTAPGEPYSLAAVREMMSELRTAYLARSFLDVRVEGPTVERLDDGSAAVTVTVVEGARFVLRGLEIEGHLPRLDAAMASLVQGNLGAPYTPHLGFRVRSQIVENHAREGYPDCATQVEEDADPETGDVRLTLRVTPGPRVTIATVDVVGNEDVDEDQIRRLVDLEPGDVYDPERIEESFHRLYRTRLFDSIRIALAEGEAGPDRTLVVAVAESPSLELFAEPGWGSYIGPFLRLGIDEHNAFGTGRRARLEGHVSPLDNGVGLLLFDPWLLDGAITGETSVSYHDRVEPSFSYSELGFDVGVRKEWTRRYSATLGYELTFTKTRDVQIGGVLPPDIEGRVNIGAIKLSVARSTRDNIVMPTRGSVVRFYSSVAADTLGSEVNLLENGVELSRVFQGSENMQVAGSARASVVAPFGGTQNVPLTRRLFNGGENTVRSFEQSELGPKDPNGEPLGGEARNVFSLELRRRIAGNFSGALFADAGNVALDYQDYFDFADLRYGVGLGLRYLLPIGPLRLDFAVNPDPEANEDDWVLHFAVGLPF